MWLRTKNFSNRALSEASARYQCSLSNKCYDFYFEFPRKTSRTDHKKSWTNIIYNCYSFNGLTKIVLPFYREDGTAEIRVTTPHTITTWVIQAVAINNETGLGLALPLQIVSKKDFFVSLTMPYSVKRGEQISILATVFNYKINNGNQYRVGLTLAVITLLCSGDDGSVIHEVIPYHKPWFYSISGPLGFPSKCMDRFDQINDLSTVSFGPLDTVHKNKCPEKRFG